MGLLLSKLNWFKAKYGLWKTLQTLSNARYPSIHDICGQIITLSDNSTFNEKIIAAFDSNISF